MNGVNWTSIFSRPGPHPPPQKHKQVFNSTFFQKGSPLPIVYQNDFSNEKGKTVVVQLMIIQQKMWAKN